MEASWPASPQLEQYWRAKGGEKPPPGLADAAEKEEAEEKDDAGKQNEVGAVQVWLPAEAHLQL